MSEWTDQHGKPVTFDQMLDQIAESILANLIAFDRAGIPRGQIQQIIGREGGGLIGGGAMFQTPVLRPLTQEQGKQLFDVYRRLLEAYDRGEIPEAVIADITERNNTANKTELIRKQLGGQ